MLSAPAGPNFVHARARLIATTHELEHQLQTLIAALAHAALQQLHSRDEQRARIGQLDPVRVALNHYAPLSAMVRMHQGVDHGLAQGLMHGSVVLAIQRAIQQKRHLQVSRQALHHPQVKLEQVVFPSAIGHHAVCPAHSGVVR